MTNNTEFNNVELTELVRVHNAAIAHHEQWLTNMQTTLAESEARHNAHVAKMESLQALNQEQLNQFTAGMIDLRHPVADYLQGRSETK